MYFNARNDTSDTLVGKLALSLAVLSGDVCGATPLPTPHTPLFQQSSTIGFKKHQNALFSVLEVNCFLKFQNVLSNSVSLHNLASMCLKCSLQFQYIVSNSINMHN